VIDPYDVAECERVIRMELAKSGASVIIARRPCVLLKGVKKEASYAIDPGECTGCKVCVGVGCPALRYANKKAAIDGALCSGCGACAEACKFGAVVKGEINER
jgi:indolepyruvate ferredoxin oxidoreductase alpha subunit